MYNIVLFGQSRRWLRQCVEYSIQSPVNISMAAVAVGPGRRVVASAPAYRGQLLVLGDEFYGREGSALVRAITEGLG